jgi:AbrB family looped-hinge helix DNA binding protein
MKISERGQITIPKNIRDRYGLHKDIEVDFIPEEEGVLLKKHSKKDHPVRALFGVLRHPSSTDSYMEEIRGR